ncbi:DNA-binding XRE family transcriptional regulator [Hydrogenoanaerobacterium saccharovorans]|uniref:DNA-binding transcriptional regulator, XRE-family HTH domain n=2 Tax=Hydrogenoanaerobacterium saccharovorans TaxID=474960 RepID=A0A1H8DGU5_9FIRM|nr:DNA-binding XRE family transcriptional regulator [Hydrogenoanaerobacterium saccharovorans]SEN06480.1 DNA-binding transcriptional regulator, XRE-family HTH domain [Hydrogenoanaerobacterium saccharovorans]
MSSIGTKVAFYRKAKGMTQEELAEKLGVSAQAVSKWENDIACPDIQLLVPLSKLFGTTTDELLSADSVKSVQLLPENERHDIKDLTLKVIVDSKDGDKVRINLPMELVKVALEIGLKIPQITNNEQLKGIDFKQIISMVESGVIGKLVEIESADGEIVNVVVE